MILRSGEQAQAMKRFFKKWRSRERVWGTDIENGLKEIHVVLSELILDRSKSSQLFSSLYLAPLSYKTIAPEIRATAFYWISDDQFLEMKSLFYETIIQKIGYDRYLKMSLGGFYFSCIKIKATRRISVPDRRITRIFYNTAGPRGL